MKELGGHSISEDQPQVKLHVNKNHPGGLWTIETQIGEAEPRIIPVFDCRQDSHKEDIARLLASYKRCVAFGVGLYGISVLVEDPRVGRNPDTWKAYYEAKEGRPLSSRIPIFAPPRFQHLYMDREVIDDDFRKFLETRETREQLFKSGVSFHLMVRVPKDAAYIHPVFIRDEGDWDASVFWWHDPDWEDISNLTYNLNPHATAGISSFNKSKEPPAFNFEGVIDFILQYKRAPFDFVVRDSECEGVGVMSSHTQIRPALKGEKKEWVIVRKGSMSADGLMKAISSPFPYRVLDEDKIADRGHPKDAILDELVSEVRDKTATNYEKRHQSKPFVNRALSFFDIREKRYSVLAKADVELK